MLAKFAAEDDKIISDPEPVFIGLIDLAESSVNITVRAWTMNEDYWEVFFRMNERVYTEFETAGISLPFAPMDSNISKN